MCSILYLVMALRTSSICLWYLNALCTRYNDEGLPDFTLTAAIVYSHLGMTSKLNHWLTGGSVLLLLFSTIKLPWIGWEHRSTSGWVLKSSLIYQSYTIISSNPLHTDVESRWQANFFSKKIQNSNFHCHIWIQHEKCIQMSTNKPSNRNILEIAQVIWRNYFRFYNFCGLTL